MGLAVPSVAEASRGLPSVKAITPSVDDEIVTSVSIPGSAVPEDVSPELALVDPGLAALLRAHLPEPADTLAPRRSPAPPPVVAPDIRADPAVVRQPDAAPLGDAPAMATREPDVVPAAVPSSVRRLRAAPLVDAAAASAIDPGPGTKAPVPRRPRPEIQPEPAPRAVVAALVPVVEREIGAGSSEGAVAAPATRPLDATPRRTGAPIRRMLVAFAAGAVVAAFVVVGVIAELGESGGDQAGVADGSTPSLSPPIAVAPAPPAAAPSPPTGAAKKQAPAAGKTSGGTKTSAAAKKKATAKKATTTKSSGAAEKSGAASAAATAPARRFAWAPVDGAVGYRVELFRGAKQVLRATTKRPVYELPSSWRHQGRVEQLSPGSYRWYVWPLLANGPSAQAVVQARLDVP